MSKVRSSKVFPGWWIALTGCLTGFWVAGYYTYCFSALLKPIADELGFSRAMTTIPSGIGRAEGGIEGPVAGYLTDRFGPKRVILFGLFVGGLGLILMNYVHALWTYIVCWGVLFATGYNIANGVPMATAIGNWFVKKRGTVLGVKSASTALAGLLVLIPVAWLIATQGWRMTCVIAGLVIWVVLMPLVALFVKDRRPEYYGLLPDGATVKAEDTTEMIDRGVEYATELGEVEFTLRQAIRTRPFWLLIAAHGFAGTAFVSVFTHAVPLLTDMGIEPVRAASLTGVSIFCAIPARLGGGFIADRLRKEHMRFGLAAGYVLQAIMFPVFLLNPTVPMAVVWLIVLAFGTGVAECIFTPLVGRYFGRKAFGSIQGTKVMFMAPLYFLAPIGIGWAYDTTGSYMDAFAVVTGLVALAGIVMSFAKPPKPPARITDIRKFV